MSGFAILTADVGISEGRTAVVRRLGWKAKKEAREKKQAEALQTQKAMGVAFAQELRDALAANGGVEKIRELAEQNPHLQYDQGTLLYKGVVSIDGAVWTPEQLDDLSDDDADLLVKKIVELSPSKSAAERKNG
jgi:hypothetical protein